MSASPQAKEGEGERVGPYRLLRQLGQGGMGSVYAARHEQLGAVRALKLLPPDADAELVRRFEREGQALAAIDGHPHLVRVHELAADGPRRYMVMDLLEGRDLRRRLNEEGPLPWDEAAALVRDLALALAHAHARGVLHRDVKPANVVFDQRGAPVLVDFGLARVQDAASLSQSGQLLGTPAYMAPEQVRGSREGLGPASDVYGLGALLYACLTGRAPFEGTLLEVLTCVLQRPPTPPRRLRPEVPAALEAVCLRALAKRPEERPPDCEALAAELEAALRDPGRTRVGLLIGPLAVCALLLAGLLALAPRSPAAAPADPAAVAVSASAPPPSDPGVGLQVREAVAAARADPAQLESAASALLDSLLGSSTEPPRIAAALAAAAGDDLPGAALQVWAARSCAARAPRVALALLAPFEGSDRARGLVSAARASTGLPFPLVELSVQLALAHGQEEEALLLLERASSPDRTRLHTLQLFVSWSRLGAGRRTSRSGDLLHADPESLLALLYCLYAVRDSTPPRRASSASGCSPAPGTRCTCTAPPRRPTWSWRSRSWSGPTR